jgi:hypothetical protein
LLFILLIAGTVLLFSLAKSSAEKAEVEKKTTETKRVAAIEYARAHTQTKNVVPAERPWTTRTFDVPDEGLRLYLYAGSARYPKLGGVLTHTSSGVSYVDLPGVDHDGMNNPDGWFTFLPNPPGSKRRIEIYNRW